MLGDVASGGKRLSWLGEPISLSMGSDHTGGLPEREAGTSIRN
jgi:hypothetical protein